MPPKKFHFRQPILIIIIFLSKVINTVYLTPKAWELKYSYQSFHETVITNDNLILDTALMLNDATLTPIYEEEPVEPVEPEEAPKTNYRSPAYEYDEDYQYEAEIEENKEAPEDERIRKKPVKKQKSNKKVASNDKKENQVAETSFNPTGDQEVKKYHINQISDEEERARLEAESNRLAEDRKRLEVLDFKIFNVKC